MEAAKAAGKRPRIALPLKGSSRYGKWRAATLASVYVLMGLHIAHWKIAGKTLAPLELNEVMYTLELGIITAGFLFMAAACIATLLFGRFFCGWGCHILALEDLCAWLLKKLHVRPKPVRSRLLLLVPLAAMLYMFVWPQAWRIAQDLPVPTAKVQSDAQGWASFQTTNFWRNLPGPGVALLTFGICGFLIVYVMGSRSFCTYGCPYGAIFRGIDRMSPGRIIATGDCSQCGACTAACPSQVVVHEELKRFGTVVNPACVKDLECVSACPNGNVKFGLARPPLLRGWSAWRPFRQPFDYHWAEELLMGLVFVATLLIFRGLYDAVPFLMTLGLGAILAVATVALIRLAYRSDVRISNLWLKQTGRMTRTGIAGIAVGTLFLVFAAHSGFIRTHEFLGYRAASAALPHAAAARPEHFSEAFRRLATCWTWGLCRSDRLAQTLAKLYAARGETHAMATNYAAAQADLEQAIRLQPDAATVRYNLAVMLTTLNQPLEAIREYRTAAALAPEDADIHSNLGLLLAGQGQMREAEECLVRALQCDPNHANAHFNLGRVMAYTGRLEEANAHFATAGQLDPRLKAALDEVFGAGHQPVAPGN